MDPKIDLKTVLDLHAKWLSNDPCGSRANLSGAYLRGAYLGGANLSRANLSGVDLSGANLSGANLSRVDLSGANLSGAYLRGANLSGANLSRVDLSGANLSGAYLRGAYLGGANLSRANLSGADLGRAYLSGAYLGRAYLSRANLSGATGAELAIAMASHLPEGDIIGWKKCRNNVIVKLLIPAKAKRSHGSERKCRASFAKVLGVFDLGGKSINHGISSYNNAEPITYTKGCIVYPDGWDENRWNTCGRGIHFFITREEAEDYQC